MINKTVVLDGDCQLIIPEDGELGVISAIRKPYPTYTGDTIVTPSDSIQVLNTELTTLTDNIIVNPVPGDYVGGDIPRRDGDDMTASGATVTAPAGYYEASASKTVPSGTEGTPTATKSAVSNHSVDITPSVTNAAGYISGGTQTGEPVTVTASELESGTKSITANGEGIDVTGYAAVDVDVPSSEPTLQTIAKTYTPTTSQQTETVTASAGYDGIEEVDITVNAMPTGTAGTPTATKGTVSNHSVTVTPSVTNTTGYIEGGTKTGTPVTVSASELDSGAKAITANGNGQDVVGYAEVDVNVPNSYTASDEGKVVSGGALVSQTSATYTDNGTYDTTLKNSVTVNVSGGGGGDYTLEDIAMRTYVSETMNCSTSFVESFAFTRISDLKEANFPLCETVGAYAFQSCGLISISFPAAVFFSSGAFASCADLKDVYAPELQRIEIGCFIAAGIENVNLQKLVSMSNQAFQSCSRMVSAYFPSLQSIGGNAFSGCILLSDVSVPNLNYIALSAFGKCSALSEISLPNVETIGSYAFSSCWLLTSLNLTGVSSIPTIGTSVFTSSPIGGYSAKAGRVGSIYVPSSLYNDFKRAQNWSSLSGRMVSV